MHYRRANVPGACYFFTVNLAERSQSLLVDHIDDLRLAFKKFRQDHDSSIHRYVQKAIISNNWACHEIEGDFGEV